MDLEVLAERAGAVLERRGFKLVTAESCTGGWISQVMTGIAGSSAWFERGFVTYSNEAKQELLNVQAVSLEAFGAVSEPVAKEMACGALDHSHAQVAVAVTGIAGPGGGSLEKPVGTVWLAWAGAGLGTQAQREQFMGNREAVRRQAVVAALTGLLEWLGERIP